MTDISIAVPGGIASVGGLLSGNLTSVAMVVGGWIVVTGLVCGRDIVMKWLELRVRKGRARP